MPSEAFRSFALALDLVKSRLNRLKSDTSLDDYLAARIAAAVGELNRMMPIKLENTMDDTVLVVDYAVWAYQNRDKPGGQPEWLRQRLRERFLRLGGN